MGGPVFVRAPPCLWENQQERRNPFWGIQLTLKEKEQKQEEQGHGTPKNTRWPCGLQLDVAFLATFEWLWFPLF